MTPLISVVTLTQDRADYLAEAIASVEAQTDPRWEHLVYDNGSSDPHVLDVLRDAKSRNPDRFFFVFPGARGPVVPALYWNILIGLSRGRYLTILDDDNRKRPGFLAGMLASLEADPTLDATTCGWGYIDAAGQRRKDRPDCHWNLATTIANLYQSNTIDSNAFVIRRSSFDRVGQFFAELPACEDWHFAIRLARSCKVAHLAEVLVDHREHPGTRSHRISRAELAMVWNRIRSEMFTPEEAAESTSSALRQALGEAEVVGKAVV